MIRGLKGSCPQKGNYKKTGGAGTVVIFDPMVLGEPDPMVLFMDR